MAWASMWFERQSRSTDHGSALRSPVVVPNYSSVQ
jgi:hypothetical protein